MSDARALLTRLLDPESRKSWDTPPAHPASPGSLYAEELAAAARKRSDADESLISGAGTVQGHRLAFVVSEFAFLAGSIGRSAADRMVAAVERATAERLPLLAAPASGGTRMQEGTVAFVQMARITAAVLRHRAAGLPYLVYLRHPTTGGVLASWGSLGHVTAAEPGALIGFLGPRIYEALKGEPFPPGIQRAEHLHTTGVVDALVEPAALRDFLSRTLSVLYARPAAAATPRSQPPPTTTAWESVVRTRRGDRPGARDLLRHGARDMIPLGAPDTGIVLALARVGTAPCVIVAQDRHAQRAGHPIDPAALRAARRGIHLAAELALPLLTIVDTPGAELSPEAESQGLAREIAGCLADLITTPAPTLCLLLGEGTGGAALALLSADRVLCAEHAWLSPLPPEGASAIVHRTTDRAAELAAAQGITSTDLLRNGIVDRVLPEPPDPEIFLTSLVRALETELTTLLTIDPAQRPTARRTRTPPPAW